MRESRKLAREVVASLEHQVDSAIILESELLEVLHMYEGDTNLDEAKAARLKVARNLVSEAKRRTDNKSGRKAEGGDGGGPSGSGGQPGGSRKRPKKLRICQACNQGRHQAYGPDCEAERQ